MKHEKISGILVFIILSGLLIGNALAQDNLPVSVSAVASGVLAIGADRNQLGEAIAGDQGLNFPQGNAIPARTA